MNDPRAAAAMTRYMAILNDIQALGVKGFARLLDNATGQEMSDMLAAALLIEEQLARYRKT
jgi:hypothetical protein